MALVQLNQFQSIRQHRVRAVVHRRMDRHQEIESIAAELIDSLNDRRTAEQRPVGGVGVHRQRSGQCRYVPGCNAGAERSRVTRCSMWVQDC